MKNLRIASWYPDARVVGRNDGNPLYATHCLRKLFGHENVLHVFPRDDISGLGSFDFNFHVDWGEDAFGWTDFQVPSPSIYWTSDTHLGYEYRLARAKRSDWVFCAQQKAVQDFIRDGIPANRCFWLPHAFDPLAYSRGFFDVKKNDWNRGIYVAKRYDVCFIGHMNDANRIDHVDRLFREFPNFYWGIKKFHEAAEVYNQSRIVFNVSARHELNMRVFEALGSGAFLLTDRMEDSETPFKDGVHYVMYDSLDDMVDKANYYLEHEDEREQIAEAGHIEALRSHSCMHRVLKMLDTVGIEYDHRKATGLLPEVPNIEAVGVAA